MSRDKQTGSDPEFAMSPEDEAFLRLVEDSYEAAGRPTDAAGAERIWGKLEARLGADRLSNKLEAPLGETVPAAESRGAEARSITSAQPRNRSKWISISSALGVAAALVLFVNFRQKDEAPGNLQTRSGASGFSAAIKVYESEGHHVRVKVLADADGHVALFRQQGKTAPLFVSNLVYKKGQGETLMLEEESESGTRYCIIGDKDQEGVKHLVELIPDLWAYLPERSCYSVR